MWGPLSERAFPVFSHFVWPCPLGSPSASRTPDSIASLGHPTDSVFIPFVSRFVSFPTILFPHAVLLAFEHHLLYKLDTGASSPFPPPISFQVPAGCYVSFPPTWAPPSTIHRTAPLLREQSAGGGVSRQCHCLGWLDSSLSLLWPYLLLIRPPLLLGCWSQSWGEL